ncbi:MAG: MBL fold metallo-hydrolase [Bacteroidales bacterium]
MKITFLGTGTSQGVPVIACNCKTCLSENPKDKRLRTSLLLSTANQTIAIDAGPDFRQQMLREKVKRLDAILLTHAHKDHIAGMDDVRAFNYIQQDAIDIWAEKNVQEDVKKEYAYVFSEYKYPGIPRMRLNEITGSPFRVKELEFVPVRVRHMHLEIFGFRIGSFAYITDASYVPESSKALLIGVKYLVVNALRKEKHISHFSLREALELVNEISPRKAFITHISHQMGLHDEVEKELPAGVVLAYDGLSLEIDDK